MTCHRLRAVRIFGLAVFLFLVCATKSPARTPRLYSQETDHVRVIYYDPAHEYLVKHLIRCFETALNFDRNELHYQPSEKIVVLVVDMWDFGNGGAVTIPKNFVTAGIEAPSSGAFESLPMNERIGSIMNHEMVHITAGDNGAGVDLVFRRLFGGKVIPNSDDPVSMLYSNLTSPRHYAPKWFHEGVATFFETMLNGGVGRALGGFDEMNFRAMVRDEAYFYHLVGIEAEGSAVDFKNRKNTYLYGTRFVTHVALKYGPDRLIRWIARTKDSRRTFAAQFEAVYGVPLAREWDDWIAAEIRWQQANLERIRQYPVTRIDPITRRTLGSVSRSFHDPERNVMYTAIQYAGQMAQIAAIHLDTGRVERLHDVDGASVLMVTSVAYDPKGRRIFFATDNSHWRDLNVLDLATGKARRLMRDTRTGDLAYSPSDRALWGIRHHNGLSTLVRIPEPFQQIEELRQFEYGTDFTGLDLSPDGQFVTGSLTDLSGKQKLVRFQTAGLKQKDASFEELHNFEYDTAGDFVFSPDGRYLYGSSYYTGVSNLWRYSFDTRKMEILTNCETGLFRPLPLADGRVVGFEATAAGFTPGFVDARPLEDVNAIQYLGQAAVEKHPALKSWKLPSPAAIDADALIRHAGRYSSVKAMELASVYPIVQGYKDTAAVGARIEIADRIRSAMVNVTASVSPGASLPASERFHAGFEGYFWDWKLSGYYNKADFYDLFGPTKNSRKGYAMRLDRTHHLLYDTPRTLDLVWNVAGYGGMDRLPDAQNVAAVHNRFAIGRLSLNYSAMRQSLGAVDDEKGSAWTLNARTTYAGRRAFPLFYGTYDRAFLLPLRNSSFWLRGAAGKVFGHIDDPFGNFYFGGFGNNWVDHLEISRYRQFYSFPGVELNAIGANHFGKAMAEWNLPPVRFKRLGTTAVYCNWARLSLFSSGLFTNFSNASTRGAYGNVGAQVDFRVVLFSWLNSTVSTGYAVATDKNGRRSSEYMVSLKLL